MIYAISPKWEIWIYGFLPEDNEDSLFWLTTAEKDSLKSPIQLPNKLIESFSYSDDLENSNFSIVIPSGFSKLLYDSQGREIRLSEILDEGTVIQIKENDKTVFSGYVMSTADSGNIQASDSMTVSGGGLESAIKEQLMVIDNPEYGDKKKAVKDVIKSPNYKKITNNLNLAFNALIDAVSDVRLPGTCIASLASHAIEYTLSRGKYGGQKMESLFRAEYGISEESYSNNYVSKIALVNQGNIGKSINFWQMMDDFARRPLYEMFVHYNEGHTISIEKDSSLQNKNILGNLVFRKTPIDELTNDEGKEASVTKINQSVFDSFKLSCNLKDIFSGISIKPGFISNMEHATYFVPILYNLSLVQKFGQRIFTVILDGISFNKEPKTKTEAANQTNKSINEFNEIQHKFMDVFGNGDRIVSGSFSGTYHRDICKGKVLHLVNDEGKDVLAKGLERYDNRFYIIGTTVSVNFPSGTANMDVSVKWGRRKSRVRT